MATIFYYFPLRFPWLAVCHFCSNTRPSIPTYPDSTPPYQLMSPPALVVPKQSRLSWSISTHLFLAFTIRLIIIVITTSLERQNNDGILQSSFTYTDIDYAVFSDGAYLSSQNKSPLDRRTFRYTPFLADLLSLLITPDADPDDPIGILGKILFAAADTLNGYLIYTLTPTTPTTALFFWLYNPLPINICTRGSAESLLPLLPVLLTISLLTAARSYTRTALAGICHGVAVHGKIYPIIYSISYLTHLSSDSNALATARNPHAILFTLVSAGTFLLLTALAHANHPLYLENGLLYHLSRVDHRHNYSPFFYPIYLLISQPTTPIPYLPRLATHAVLPQTALLLFTSLRLAPHDLPFTLFLQSFMFVTLNKVITGQYFTWYASTQRNRPPYAL